MSRAKLRILIVEDDQSHVEVIKRYLLDHAPAFEVATASSLQRCADEIEARCPDLLLLDLHLPDGTALEYLKKNNSERPFPVLVMTSQGNEMLAVEALKSGVLDYIVKTPETFRAMPRIIDRSLREWQTLQKRHQAEAEAQRAHREWESTFDAMTDVVTIHDQQRRIVRANQAAYRLTGAQPGALIGKRCNEALWKEGNTCATCPLATTLWDGNPHSGTRDHECDGKVFEITTTPFPADSEQNNYFIHIAKDVTTRKEYEDQLQHQATHDHLTGLANRMLLEDRLEQAIKQAQRANRLVAVLLLDLDRFKNVNDGYGHATGDELLCMVAARLKISIRQTDTVARLGGDEFLVLLTNVVDLEAVQTTTANILKSLAKPYQIRGRKFNLTASVGGSIYPHDGSEGPNLVRNADIAMYEAKQRGNHFSYYSEEMNRHVVSTLEMENDLHLALANKELCLHYQPKVDLATGRVNGCEALLRWNHPRRGMVSPGQFIPLAEQTGLIVPIGTWVIEEACRQSLAWQAEGQPPVRIAVNLSARQFRQGNLATTVSTILSSCGLDPGLLELELTESMIMDDPQGAEEVLATLKDLGVSLSLDDFGTGYSSLNYLSRFPVDHLKIDMSFIRDIGTSDARTAVVSSIIDIAHNLQLSAIAEGVETAEQLKFLTANDCDAMQGYLFSKPLPAAEFKMLLCQGTCLNDIVPDR